MRRAIGVLIALAVVAALVIGLSQAGGGDKGANAAKAAPFHLDDALARLRGAPKPLAALHRDANKLLGGGQPALDKHLHALHGHPVVVNKWASWCLPCRAEFPVFEQVATQRGREIGFLGLNAGDKAPAARKFLADRPLPYPSIEDPDQALARSLKVPDVAPVTVFIDAKGKTAFIHSGEYRSVQQLDADIDRYLG